MRIAVAGGTGLVGRHVVQAGRDAGHDLVVLARSAGVDVCSGAGLERALARVDVVIDTTNADTNDQAPATEFFVASTSNLGCIGAAVGVRHLVVLSIVGIDGADTGYYAAKLAQEQAALGASVPVTIVRTTQFHEFPAQMIRRGRIGLVAELPDLRVQTVAARTVGRILAEVAEGPPKGRARDVGGPEEAELVLLARRFVERFGLGIEIAPVEGHLPTTALLPGEGARLEGPTFEEWLSSDDAEGLGRARWTACSDSRSALARGVGVPGGDQERFEGGCP